MKLNDKRTESGSLLDMHTRIVRQQMDLVSLVGLTNMRPQPAGSHSSEARAASHIALPDHAPMLDLNFLEGLLEGSGPQGPVFSGVTTLQSKFKTSLGHRESARGSTGDVFTPFPDGDTRWALKMIRGSKDTIWP
eukprot:2481690-Alexandrium_andersonii.AAC.1